MTENDRLTGPPIVVIQFCSVINFNRAHIFSFHSLCSLGAAMAWLTSTDVSIVR